MANGEWRMANGEWRNVLLRFPVVNRPGASALRRPATRRDAQNVARGVSPWKRLAT
jgi:hypothetical protein